VFIVTIFSFLHRGDVIFMVLYPGKSKQCIVFLIGRLMPLISYISSGYRYLKQNKHIFLLHVGSGIPKYRVSDD
jgi:hypothetical protein